MSTHVSLIIHEDDTFSKVYKDMLSRQEDGILHTDPETFINHILNKYINIFDISFIYTPFPRIVVHAPLSEKTRFFDIFVGGIVPPLTGACTSISGYTCMHQYAKTCPADNGAPWGKHYIAYGASFECFECFLTDFTPRLMVHAPVVPGNGACTSLWGAPQCAGKGYSLCQIIFYENVLFYLHNS